jgi:hypothetical protein
MSSHHKFRSLALLALFVAAVSAAAAHGNVDSTPTAFGGTYKKATRPDNASVYFINLKDGDVVTSPVNVQFGLKGMGVAPAGAERENTGHHHLLINAGAVDVNGMLPMSDQVRHFGAGQTETSLDLKPGTYTLQLLLGDQNHVPHHPPVMSAPIRIQVR